MTDAQTIDVFVTDDIVAPVTLVSTGAVWRYFDGGVDQDAFWRGTYFDDASWARGPAPLGYRTSNETTIVSYGPSSNNKYVTTYFRRPFLVPDVTAVQNLNLRVLRNDGVVVYINGAEVLRDNLPNGTISYTNFASKRINGAAETNIVTQTVDPAFLFNGMNTVAAEIHQFAANGTDIIFDLELIGSAFVPRDAPISLQRSGSAITLTWPAAAGLLNVCSTPSLVPPVIWTPVELFGAPSVQITNSICILDVDAATNQTQFFRLQTP